MWQRCDESDKSEAKKPEEDIEDKNSNHNFFNHLHSQTECEDDQKTKHLYCPWSRYFTNYVQLIWYDSYFMIHEHGQNTLSPKIILYAVCKYKNYINLFLFILKQQVIWF